MTGLSIQTPTTPGQFLSAMNMLVMHVGGPYPQSITDSGIIFGRDNPGLSKPLIPIDGSPALVTRDGLVRRARVDGLDLTEQVPVAQDRLERRPPRSPFPQPPMMGRLLARSPFPQPPLSPKHDPYSGFLGQIEGLEWFLDASVVTMFRDLWRVGSPWMNGFDDLAGGEYIRDGAYEDLQRRVDAFVARSTHTREIVKDQSSGEGLYARAEDLLNISTRELDAVQIAARDFLAGVLFNAASVAGSAERAAGMFASSMETFLSAKHDVAAALAGEHALALNPEGDVRRRLGDTLSRKWTALSLNSAFDPLMRSICIFRGLRVALTLSAWDRAAALYGAIHGVPDDLMLDAGDQGIRDAMRVDPLPMISSFHEKGVNRLRIAWARTQRAVQLSDAGNDGKIAGWARVVSSLNGAIESWERIELSEEKPAGEIAGVKMLLGAATELNQ